MLSAIIINVLVLKISDEQTTVTIFNVCNLEEKSNVVKFTSENQIKVAFDWNTSFDLVWYYMNVYISYNVLVCHKNKNLCDKNMKIHFVFVTIN